jgi:predicted DNA-binding protein (UPF0251 family)
MLAGKTLPSPKFYAALADAFRVSLREVLIQAGAATDDLLEATALRASEAKRISPEEAAERVGIRKPANVQLVVSMINQMLQQEATEDGAA